MHPFLVAVIDDEPAIIEYVETILGEEGYGVVAWRAGAGAHARIAAARPGLVLLDMQMETPDAGLHVLREMRADARTRRIPVVVISTRTHLPDEVAALGATAMPKPFTPGELLAAVAQSERGARAVG